MNRKKAWNDLQATLNNLEDSISLFRKGRRDQYRSVAIGLRTLLCDKNTALLGIFPRAAFHPLNGFAARLAVKQSYLLENLVFSPPGIINSDGKGNVRIEKLFWKGNLLLLEQWLNQPLISKRVTLREFIKSIADKEGKHLDKEYDSTLQLVRHVNIANKKYHPELIVTIGEYVAGLLQHVVKTFFTKQEIEEWINNEHIY